MLKNTDWLPAPRANRIAMARDWLLILSQGAPPWGIHASDVEELRTLTVAAEQSLAAAMSSERTKVMTAACRAAFDALSVKMRFLKNHYFLSPPLTDADFVSLKLKPPKFPRSPVPPPPDQAEADISRPGEHLIRLHLRAVTTATPDPYRYSYGFRIYWGILPFGGATTENAVGVKRELINVPVSGEELPHSRFTRRRTELFDFPQEDRGKTIYFCIRFENAKGEAGPWGPIFSAIIS